MKRIASLPSFLLIFLLLFSLPGLASADGKSGVLIVAFGTSVPEAMPSFDALDKDFRKAFDGQPVVWAYTSDIIRKKLAKEGKKIFSVNEALNDCSKKGVTDLRVQPLHVTGGEEYIMLNRMIVRNLNRFPDRFSHVWLGKPLIESWKDLEEVCAAVLADSRPLRRHHEALILMGHGNDRGPGDLAMFAADKYLSGRDARARIATVEGANSFEKLLPQLKKAHVKKAVIQPLMVVAGDHARNDLAGSEDDSWARQLKKNGIKTVASLKGLGEIAAVRAVYLRHAKEAKDDLAHPKKVD